MPAWRHAADVTQAEFKSAGPQVLTLTLYFDTYETGDDVSQTTRKLWNFMLTKVQKTSKKGKKVPPPQVAFEWGVFCFVAYITNMFQKRSSFIEGLKDRNIGTSVHYLPVHMHPFYRDKYGYRPEDNPVAAAAYERMISLPLHAGLSDQDVDDVIEAVRDLVAAHSA